MLEAIYKYFLIFDMNLLVKLVRGQTNYYNLGVQREGNAIELMMSQRFQVLSCVTKILADRLLPRLRYMDWPHPIKYSHFINKMLYNMIWDSVVFAQVWILISTWKSNWSRWRFITRIRFRNHVFLSYQHKCLT